MNRRLFALAVLLTFGSWLLASSAGQAQVVETPVQPQTGDPAAEAAEQAGRIDRNEVLPTDVGRIWNISDQPLVYRLSRTTGPVLTPPTTLKPGAYHEFRRPPKRGETTLEGLDDPEPSLVIQFRTMGGRSKLRLPTRRATGDVVPHWFYVRDSNGFGHLIQSRTIDEAEQEQKRLQAQRPLTANEISRLRDNLRANSAWVPDGN